MWSQTVDTAPPNGPTNIAPFVGIRSEEVQALLIKCLELPAHPDNAFIGTAGSNAGYILTGQYLMCYDSSDAELLGVKASTPAEVITAIHQAREILQTYMDLERLPEAFSIPGASGPGYRYKLALIYLLSGHVDRMHGELAEIEQVDCADESGVCEQSRRFIRNVLAGLV